MFFLNRRPSPRTFDFFFLPMYICPSVWFFYWQKAHDPPPTPKVIEEKSENILCRGDKNLSLSSKLNPVRGPTARGLNWKRLSVSQHTSTTMTTTTTILCSLFHTKYITYSPLFPCTLINYAIHTAFYLNLCRTNSSALSSLVYIIIKPTSETFGGPSLNFIDIIKPMFVF